MTQNRGRASRTDGNHTEIVARYRSHGFSVFSTHDVPGELDLVVGGCGVDCRVEIKDGAKPPSKRRLTPAERETIATWRGRKPVIIESVDDVDAHVAAIRAERTYTPPPGVEVRRVGDTHIAQDVLTSRRAVVDEVAALIEPAPAGDTIGTTDAPPRRIVSTPAGAAYTED